MASPCKVSVLVTFYNQETCVDRALGSVMAQDIEEPIEVLVGDDGSSDGTWVAIQSWIERYPETIRAFRMSREDGVKNPIARASRNRLALTLQAKGCYVVYLDGDDYFPDNSKLRKQSDILDSRVDCGSCAHNFEYVDELGKRISLAYPEKAGDFEMSFDDFWSTAYLHASCFMFRMPSREIIDKADGCNFDDNTIVYLLAQERSIRFLNSVMFSYVQKQGSTWNSMDILKRVLANQRDYAFEVRVGKKTLYSSMVRHSFEFLSLALFSRRRLQEYSSYVEQLGLIEEGCFGKIWTKLNSEAFFVRLSCRCELLMRFFIPACRKMIYRISFNKGYVKGVV